MQIVLHWRSSCIHLGALLRIDLKDTFLGVGWLQQTFNSGRYCQMVSQEVSPIYPPNCGKWERWLSPSSSTLGIFKCRLEEDLNIVLNWTWGIPLGYSNLCLPSAVQLGDGLLRRLWAEGWMLLLRGNWGCFFSLCPTWHLSLTEVAKVGSQPLDGKKEWVGNKLIFSQLAVPFFPLNLDPAQNKVTDVLLQQR